MTEFFNMIGDVVSLLNNWKIIGDLSVWSILLTVLVSTTIIKLLKGAKTK